MNAISIHISTRACIPIKITVQIIALCLINPDNKKLPTDLLHPETGFKVVLWLGFAFVLCFIIFSLNNVQYNAK